MADLDTRFLVHFFRLAAARLEENRARLCALDGEVGDGDHGTSMASGFAALAGLGRQKHDLPPDEFLKAAAAAFIGDVGATVGPLYAGALLAAARQYGSTALPAMSFDRLLTSFVEGIAVRGKAHQGDKTMLDAWLPAAHAAQEASRAGAAVGEVAVRALEAGRKGAEATATMIASRGRASRLKERSLGHLDPGAVSAVLILEALVEAAQMSEERSRER